MSGKHWLHSTLCYASMMMKMIWLMVDLHVIAMETFTQAAKLKVISHPS
jgi:hypothetical protein